MKVCRHSIKTLGDKCPKTNDGRTPEDIARTNGHMEIVEFFTTNEVEVSVNLPVTVGSRPSIPNSLLRENTILELASFSDFVERNLDRLELHVPTSHAVSPFPSVSIQATASTSPSTGQSIKLTPSQFILDFPKRESSREVVEKFV